MWRLGYLATPLLNKINTMKKLLALIALVITTNALQAQTPIASYPFTGNANDAIGSLNGTVNGATLTADRFGNANSAYSFDGVSNNISIPHNAIFNFTSYTVSLWFKYQGVGTAGKSIWSLISKNDNGNGFDDAIHIWVQENNKFTGGRIGSGNPNLTGFSAGPAVDDGNWHQSTVVCDNVNDQIRQYLDGVLISTTPFTSNPFNNNANIKIGYWEAYNNFFNGSIDEINIYNTALTTTQVANEYSTSSIGLVAYYPFTGDANDEVGSNNGTINGATLTTDRFGNANSAYSFDGVDDIITAPIATSNTSNFSLTGWVKLNANNTTQMLLCNGNSSLNGWGLYLTSNGILNVIHGGLVLSPTSTTLNINQWYFLSLVNDAGVTKVYVNGVSVLSTTLATPLPPTSLFYMSSNTINTEYLNGSMDEVKIYNIPLSAAQVANEYTQNNSGLVAYYPLNGNANDAVGSLNGIVNGATLTTDRFGNANSAYSFDGVDDFIGLNSNFGPYTELTLSAWYKVTGTSPNLQAIVSSDASGKFVHMQISDASASDNAVYNDGNGAIILNRPAAVLNVWKQVVITAKSGNTRIYENGVCIDSSTVTFTTISPANLLRIGSGYLNGRFFNGSIDEVKIYNTALSTTQVVNDYNANVGVVAYYPFTGNANDAIGTLNGIVNGATPTSDRFGNANSAYSFDGINNSIQAGNLNFANNNYSISFWLNATNNTTENTIVSAADPSDLTKTLILVEYNNGLLRFLHRNPAGTTGGIEINSTQSLIPNQWNFVTCIKENTTLKMFVNGTLVTSTTNVAVTNISSTPYIEFGRLRDGTNNFIRHLDGKLDDIKILNYALSTPEVQASFANGNQAQKPGSGNAISFDGSNDYVQSGDFNIGASDFTMETWIKPNSNTDAYLITNRTVESGAPGNWFILLRTPDGKIDFEMADAGTPNTNVGILSNVTTPLGNWSHVAAVRSGTSITLYINGIAQPTYNDLFVRNITTGLNTGILGAWTTQNAKFYNGSMDEVRIWNTALTQTQLRDRMCHKITNTDALYSNLVAYYNFDESTGNTAFDGTANANNGTLTNSPTRITSGAAIGNTSTHNYVTTGLPSANLSSNAQDNLAVSYTAGTYTGEAGTHIYTVNEVPNTTNGIGVVGTNDRYFGVFNANLTSPTYTAMYKYTGNPFVTTNNENGLGLFKRTDNAATAWAGTSATLNTTTKTLTTTGQNTEYMLGVSDGKSLQFDGTNDYVDLGNWFTYQNFSIEMWLKPGATQVEHADIIDNNHTSSNSWVFQQDGVNTNSYAFGGGFTGVTGINLAANIWQHVVLVSTTTTKKAYVNGVLVGSSNGGIIPYNSQYFRLGRWGGGGRNWNGSMDLVTIWDKELTLAEIQNHQTCNPIVGEPNLISFYDFNQGIANGTNTGNTTLVDATTAHNGTLNNFALTGTTSNWTGEAGSAINCTGIILVAGSIGTNQTVCLPETINELTSISAAFNNGSLTMNYQWQDSTVAGTWQDISGAINLTYQPLGITTNTWYRRIVAASSLTAYSNEVSLTVNSSAGLPSVFPINAWNFYAYDGVSVDSNNINYRGSYSRSTLDFNTTTDFNSNSNPSTATGYAGCPIAAPGNAWSLYAKRQGFPTGPYTMVINLHDDLVKIFKDGVLIQSGTCCNNLGSTIITLGTLDANSQIECRVANGGGPGQLQITLQTQSLNAGAISGNQTICTNETPALLNNTALAFGGNTTNITYQWQDSIVGGVWTNTSGATNTTFQPIALTQTTWYRRLAINDVETNASNEVQMTVNTVVGNPATFGTNQWNVYAYNGNDFNTLSNNTYKGFYTSSPLNINTNNDWNNSLSPSSALNYQGCPVNNDNFIWVMKRQNFPVGNYYIDIPSHDDFIRIYVDGVQVFEHLSCCDAHNSIMLGILNATSTVEIRCHEASGPGYAQVNFISDLQGGTVSSNQTFCNLTSTPTLFASTQDAYGGLSALTYQWQDSIVGGTWTNISGATASTFQAPVVTQDIYYRRKVTNLANEIAYSNQLFMDFAGVLFYADADGDGFGNPAVTQLGCTAPIGYVADSTDCDDNNINIHAPILYFVDADHDGFGSNATQLLCAVTPPVGFSINNTDCDDNNANIHPGATEICGNGVDEDCNGLVDDGSAQLTITTNGSTNLCTGGSVLLTSSFPTNNLWSNGETTQSISVSDSGNYFVSNTQTFCTSLPITVTINAIPFVNATISNQSLNNGITTNAILFTGNATSYSWTNDNTTIGLAASGSGNIQAFTAINTSNNPILATITVTPNNTYNGVTCAGTSISFTILVYPSSIANTVANQVYCGQTLTTPIVFSSDSDVLFYTWTNNAPSIGLSASGTGNIPAFLTAGFTGVPLRATIVVTPHTSDGNGGSINRSPMLFKIIINPIPTLNNPTVSQSVCNGSPSVGINFTGAIPGTTFDWSNNEPAIGLAASGTGDIPSFVGTNAGTALLNATVTITPNFTINGLTCAGISKYSTFEIIPTITVNPEPNRTLCNGETSAQILLFANVPVVITWTNSNPLIGLEASNSGHIRTFTASNTTTAPISGTITVTPTYSNNGVTCVGTPYTFTITVNPAPFMNALGNQAVCANSPTVPVTFASNIPSTTYTWTNNTTSIGLAASGTGEIPSFTATNSFTFPLVATITVTSNAEFNGIACIGNVRTFTITVNPNVVMNNVSNKVYCNGNSSLIVFSGIPGITNNYVWTNSNTNVGIAASGTGNINSFTATNLGSLPIEATIIVTPNRVFGADTCFGQPKTFTVTVNPTPVVSPVTSQFICNGESTTNIDFVSNLSGTTFNWTNSNTTIGLAASGTGSIPSFIGINNGGNVVYNNIIVTADLNGCSTGIINGQTFTIGVYTKPVVNPVSDVSVCNTNSAGLIFFTSVVPGGLYTWTNSNTTIGLAASGTNFIPNFNATNTGTTPVTATITVTNQSNTCVSDPITFSIIVNPTPILSQSASQYICDGELSNVVSFNSNMPGSTFSWSNSNTNIGLGANGTGDLPAFIGTNNSINPISATIFVNAYFTQNGITCGLNIGKQFNINVYAKPIMYTNNIADVTYCNGSSVSTPNFSSNVLNTSYSWTNSNTNIGLSASGTGNLPDFNVTNNGTAPITATIIVTPIGPNNCIGLPETFTITVNPIPTVNAVANQRVCNGESTIDIEFTGAIPGTSYNWNNLDSSIGLAASGIGDIPGFITTNTFSYERSALLIVHPYYTNNNVTCAGQVTLTSIAVIPTPTIDAVSNKTFCKNTITDAILFVGNADYLWTNSNTTIGIAASGTGNILGFLAKNNTALPNEATITVTPILYNNSIICPSIPITFTITVLPEPMVNSITDKTYCAGEVTNAITITGNATSYQWGVSNTTIGLSGDGISNTIPSFTTINTNTNNLFEQGIVSIAPILTDNGTSCYGNSENFAITVYPLPIISASGPTTFCQGGSVTLSSNVFSFSLWSNGATTFNISATNSGSYTLIDTSSQCTSLPTIVNVNTLPIPVIAGNTTFCTGSSTILDAGNYASYLWTGGTTTQTKIINAIGTYIVTVTDANGCSGISLPVSITTSNGPLYYTDADNDSFGDINDPGTPSCTPIVGKSTNNTDCNDNNPNINPGAVEIANNGIDDNCDGQIDEGSPFVFYRDFDNDGFGNAAVTQLGYSAPVGYVTDNTDCDDADSLQHPGQVWYIDNDEDDYGTGVFVTQCLRPLHGYIASELTATTGDCNDNDENINPSAQYFSFTGNPNFVSSICEPAIGTSYTSFHFEADYFDATNALPIGAYPRLILDFEGNGNFSDANDKSYVMTEDNPADITTSNGKRYVVDVSGLPPGTNWTARIIVSDGGACTTTFGPFTTPDVFELPNLVIFANDITFSNQQPNPNDAITVSAVVHNKSDFEAQNFVVHLTNQYDLNTVYPDIIVSNLSAHTAITVSWNITTPNVPAWVPMEVKVDFTNVISESNELDNRAMRPFVNGNFNLPGGINVTASVSPFASYSSPNNAVVISGSANYFGTTVPLPDPSVAGATLTFTITETGAAYTTYTNSNGYYSFSFPGPLAPGLYHITGSITDYTLTGNLATTFVILIPNCLPDLYVGFNLAPNPVVVGNPITGTLTVSNYGCAATTLSTLLDLSQSSGNPILNDLIVPPLVPGQTFTANISVTFNTVGTQTICGTADATYLVAETNENNTNCQPIIVYPALPDIIAIEGPGNGFDCTTGYIRTRLKNIGGIATGAFTAEVLVSKNGGVATSVTQTVASILPGYEVFVDFPFNYAVSGAGNYTYTINCDVPLPNGVVTELNENNNTSVFANVIAPCQPNLVLAGCEQLSVQSANLIFPGTLNLNAYVTNNGNQDATGPVQIIFSYSTGGSYPVTYNGDIAVGQTVTVTTTAPIPPPTSTVLTATVDPVNQIAELNEKDNAATGDMCWEFANSVLCNGIPNFWERTYHLNQPVNLFMAVTNSGLYNAVNFKVRFLVSGPGIIGTLNLGDATIANFIRTCHCPEVATLNNGFVFTQNGTYHFTVIVDPENNFVECNELNNVFEVDVVVNDLPDMRILSQYINPTLLNPDVGESVSFDLTYENIGLTNLSDQMKLKFTMDNMPFDSIYPVSGLPTGAHATFTMPLSWSSNVPGIHIMRAIIDADNQVAENNELNNEATRAIVVGQSANLYFQVFNPSNANPSLNQTIQVDTRVGNNGDLSCEADVTFYYVNDFLDTIQINTAHIIVPANDSLNLSQFVWNVLDNSTTLIAKIINATSLEYTYDDNTATALLGAINVSIVSSQESCVNAGNGSASVNASIGNQPYSYFWSNGFVGQVLTATAGNYTVTVTDNTGQSVTSSTNITTTIDNLPPVLFNIPADIIYNATNGICPAVINWAVPSATDNCGLDTIYANHYSGEAFNVGTTIVTYTAVDQSGNSSSASFNVQVNGLPLVFAGNDASSCVIANLNASAPSWGTGMWSSLTTGAVFANASSNQTTASNLNPNNNVFIWTVTNGTCGTKNDTVIINIQAGLLWYMDADGDGYGNAASSMLVCSQPPPGYVLDSTDCDDNNINIHAPISYFVDADHDGFGSTTTQMVCALTPPVGFSSNNTDCDDNNVNVHPGAIEIIDNGIDDDCNGIIDNICPEGEIIWQKSFGGSVNDSPNSIIQTDDGGYISAGLSQSNNGDVTINQGNPDYWIVKTDNAGNLQ